MNFRASAKGAYGIGDVCLQPLRDTWGTSSIRINNKLDTTMKPFPSKEGQKEEKRFNFEPLKRNVTKLYQCQPCTFYMNWLSSLRRNEKPN